MFDLSRFAEVLKPIGELLESLLGESGAIAVYLIDTDGNRIAAVGDTQHFDIATLEDLTGGTERLSSLSGAADYGFVFHAGADQILLAPLDVHRMLTIVFDRRTSLNTVRAKLNELAPRLEALLPPEE